MNGETIITAENIGLAAEVICAELPIKMMHRADGEPAGMIRWIVDLYIKWQMPQVYDRYNPPTLAELRDEVRERFAQYLQEDGR